MVPAMTGRAGAELVYNHLRRHRVVSQRRTAYISTEQVLARTVSPPSRFTPILKASVGGDAPAKAALR
jgi:hypothetical protein